MRFKGLDLNLLIALDVLLEERSVSRTADRLFLSQPAVSASLRRLREYFNDPILVQHGKQMIPTPVALSLQQDLSGILSDLNKFITTSTAFDPRTTQRKFVICASDYINLVLFVPLAEQLRRDAPDLILEIIPPADDIHDLMGRGQIDFALLPEQLLREDFHSEFLFEERFVLAGCAKNTLLQGPIDEEAFFNARQVVVKLGQRNPISISDRNLEQQHKNIRTDIFISSFPMAPEMVINTDRVTIMHERLANIFVKRLPLRVQSLPFELAPLKEFFQCHPSRLQDSGMNWLLQLIKKSLISKTNANQ